MNSTSEPTLFQPKDVSRFTLRHFIDRVREENKLRPDYCGLASEESVLHSLVWTGITSGFDLFKNLQTKRRCKVFSYAKSLWTVSDPLCLLKSSLHLLRFVCLDRLCRMYVHVGVVILLFSHKGLVSYHRPHLFLSTQTLWFDFCFEHSPV